MKTIILTSKLSNVLVKILWETSVLVWKKKVGFISNAADMYKNKRFVEEDRELLLENWFILQDIDLKLLDWDNLRKVLWEQDIIFVSGGNTFYLLEKMRESWFDELLQGLLNTWKIYIGSSAGSVVIGKSIKHVETLDDPNQSNIQNYEGLWIIPVFILPHFGKEKYIERMRWIVESYWKKDLLTISDDEYRVISY